ncbi:hypothetical protein PHISCL_07140 [Aspergillus sclerotialis]|uniref:MARVEL domain-containing protein n=1 Tax=Aspergillus sclerotialis TaxID=2070753 RepID=A0A3A2ZMD8_9EURO|nr:hypothetical protein PHISCL_07140 [Aspergillus sclerotialis]
MQSNGALGATFHIARAFQGCSLIAIIGMTANFIAQIVSANATPPNILIGTIAVTCVAVIYCVITSILMIDNILPFLACAILDLLVLIALIVVAVIIGKPLSYLKCGSLHLPSDEDGDSSALAFTTHLKSYLNKAGEKIDYINWIGASKAVCLEGKAIWGLCIALCILFFFSAVCAVCLWKRKKSQMGEKLDG